MSSTIQQADERYSKRCEPCVLVAFASKHGATRDIAGSIAVQLRMDDLDVDLLDVADVKTVEGYVGVILGSAVYMGKLLPEVRAFVTRLESDLNRLPVWLFSSGPVGEDPKRHAEATEVEEIVTALRTRGHTVFAGKLDKRHLGLAERLAVNLVHAPEGDFRDWSAIESWARDIAHQLNTEGDADVKGVSRSDP